MYHTIAEFLADWQQESASTAGVMAALTTAALAQRVTPDDRSLGWTAWHIVTTLAEMPGRVGLSLSTVKADSTSPSSAPAIAATYKAAAAELAGLIQAGWTDETLQVEDEMYGMKWTRAVTLTCLIRHEIHHRAQMTVLMRQAGLRVPGVYGPAREDWDAMGVPAPAV